MLSKKDKAALRSRLFRHLDGIVTAPTAYELYKRGITDLLLQQQTVDVDELATGSQAHAGYLNVALRVLASQGWLHQRVDNAANKVTYSTVPLSERAFGYFNLYKDVVELMKFSGRFHPRRFELEPFLKLEELFARFRQNYDLSAPADPTEARLRQQIFGHIEGMIVGPTVVHLGMSGMFHKYFMETRFKPEEFHQDGESFGRLLDMLVYFGWFEKKGDTYQFTETGLFYARRASAYGVTVSYIPMLRRLDELLFGQPQAVLEHDPDSPETHVDRAMNVWGSGGAHANYFKVVDEIIIDIFNRPIEEQPRGILDMGCGNGAFLQHLFNIIEQQTQRGKMLEEHPLILVGVDYNQTALRITRANLIQADIWAKVIWGDIGRPDRLADDLRSNYDIELADLLNVRTFLDHNRPWQPPAGALAGTSTSTGAFAWRGARLSNNEVEQSLTEHLQRWAPYVHRHGLLIIELHTLPPATAADHLGQTPVTAYDATHGYSDQYIVEEEVFRRAMQRAGLRPNPALGRCFPSTELPVVSINLFETEKK